jgi:polyhydroxybutyrate depolymerase
VGSALYIELTRLCQRSRATPILIMNGTGDPSVPYEGVEVPDSQGGDPIRITISVQETVATFVRRNGCSFTGVSTTYAESGRSPGTHVVKFEPHDCDANAPVLFYLINGGGHTWPGVEDVMPADSFGPTNMDMHASEVIWDFFSQNQLTR